MATIDHPLTEANRVISSGWMEPEFMARVLAELDAGPRTPERIRASVFELLGDGFRGHVPVVVEDVLEPAFTKHYLDVECWTAIGAVDEGSVLRVADGTWFGIGRVNEAAIDRQMVLFGLSEQDAGELRAMLAESREPVLAIDPLNLFQMGSEKAYRAFMTGGKE